MNATETGYVSGADLAAAIRRAEAAHRDHNARGGTSEDWPAWYAAYMVAEKAGTDLPS